MNVNFRDTGSDKPRKLREFYDFARVALLFEESTGKSRDLKFFVRSGSRILWQCSLGPNEALDSAIVHFSQIVCNAWEIAKHLDVQDEVELTADILMAQEERLRILRSLLSTESQQMKVEGFFDRSQVSSGSRAFVPFGVEVILGDLKGTFMFSVWGDVKYTGLEQGGAGSHCEIKSSEKRLERTFTSARGEEGLSLSAAVMAIADAYDDVTCWILEHYKLPESS